MCIKKNQGLWTLAIFLRSSFEIWYCRAPIDVGYGSSIIVTILTIGIQQMSSKLDHLYDLLG